MKTFSLLPFLPNSNLNIALIEFRGRFRIGGKFKLWKSRTGWNAVGGYSRLIVELRWPFLLLHITGMIRNREEEEEMGGKKKKRPRGEKRNECVGRRRRPPPTDRLSPLVARGTWSPDGTAPTGWRQSKRKKKKGKNWQAVVGRKRARRNWAEAAPTVRAFDRSARLHQTSFMRPSSSHTYAREYAGATLSRRCSFLLLRVRLQINKRPKRLAGGKSIWVAGLLPAGQAQRRHYKQQQQRKRKTIAIYNEENLQNNLIL